MPKDQTAALKRGESNLLLSAIPDQDEIFGLFQGRLNSAISKAILWITEAGLILKADRWSHLWKKKVTQAGMLIDEPQIALNGGGFMRPGTEAMLTDFKALSLDDLKTWIIIWILLVSTLPLLNLFHRYCRAKVHRP